MNSSRLQSALCLLLLLAVAPVAWAQRGPRIGYVCPAGGRPGDTFLARISGQFLDGVTNAHISGDGIQATVVEYIKPLNGKQINLLRDRQLALQQGLRAAGRDDLKIRVRSELDTNVVQTLDRAEVAREMSEIRAKLANPKNRRQENAQLAEDVTLRVVVATNAAPGDRELRLRTAAGLSNPLVFRVGLLPEFAEQEPNNKLTNATLVPRLPAVLNGQVQAGDLDCFRFRLRQGAHLVVSASARELIPYLADAVPGWFQATLALYDAKGKELAYVDDFRFHPDPVLHYEIPRDGEYALEIKDAIYRGREDFVYRITVGELPFVTSIFPLGGPAGAQTEVEVKGWNLPVSRVTMDARDQESGTRRLSVRNAEWSSNLVPFAVDTLPECREREPNNALDRAQQLTLPAIVNGRIESPGDLDVFRFEGRAGEEVVAEIEARRLDSPLDSLLKLSDAAGRQLALNDDHEDKASGLNTHHADSYIRATLPADGSYCVQLADAQRNGGPDYAYRLRVSPPRPDFELRVVPSTVNARPGGTTTLTVYGLRKDGMTNEIVVGLKDAPTGFRLSGGRLAGTNEQVRLTLTAPFLAPPQPVRLSLVGRATIHGRDVTHLAVPAEDMMQAFAYRHLVPAQDLLVTVIGRGGLRAGANFPASPATKARPKNRPKAP